MLVLKLELWRQGDPNRAEEIGRAYIANVGGDSERGEYQVAVCRRGTTGVPKEIYTASGADPEKVRGRYVASRVGRVENYPRLSYNVWRLIIRGLRACFPEEK